MSKKNDKPEDKPELKAEAPAAKTKEPSAPKNRRVMLFGRMENEICTPVVKRILKLNDLDPEKPIDLFINSSGGNGYNADAVIAMMHRISAPVNTICLGHALSGACEILASGTGTRSAYEFSTLMFHQTLWEADGDITNLEIQAKQGQRFRDAQIELLHRCTGQDKKTLRNDIERDFYLSAQDALKYGLIDEIIYHTAGEKRNGNNGARRKDEAHKESASVARAASAAASAEKKSAGKKSAEGKKSSPGKERK